MVELSVQILLFLVSQYFYYIMKVIRKGTFSILNQHFYYFLVVCFSINAAFITAVFGVNC